MIVIVMIFFEWPPVLCVGRKAVGVVCLLSCCGVRTAWCSAGVFVWLLLFSGSIPDDSTRSTVIVVGLECALFPFLEFCWEWELAFVVGYLVERYPRRRDRVLKWRPCPGAID